MTKPLTFLCVTCLLLTGCAKVKHLDQLLTLKGLAEEQTRLNAYVDEQDRNFERMLKEAEAGTLGQYSTKAAFRDAFGEPVFTRSVREEGEERESWLYRYATEYFGAAKVYLTFGPEGDLVNLEYIEATDGKIEQETAQENEPEAT